MGGCVAVHVRIFVALALYTGARKGALLDLTWDRVSERFIDLNPVGRTQTRKRRPVVLMSPELWTELEKARAAATSDHVIERAGKPLRSVRKGVAEAARRAGLAGVTPHVLRHTAATWMAQRGVSLWQIAGWLGNSVEMVQRVYGHHHPEYLADAMAAQRHSAPPVQIPVHGMNEKGKGSRNDRLSSRKSQ